MNKKKKTQDLKWQLYFGINYTIIRLKNAYKIRSLSSYMTYTQENKHSSLLDFSPLLSNGDCRLIWKASLYKSRFQLSS